jgi:hypothetical protein
MKNPIENAASWPPDMAVLHSVTEEELLDYFKDYATPFLGEAVYHRRFSNGVELKTVIGIFPKMAFIRCTPPNSIPRMTPDECDQFVKEVEANTDFLFKAAAEKAGIDPDKARTLGVPGTVVLFQPKDTI